MQISIHVIRIHTVVEQNICVANTCNKAGDCPVECQCLQLLMKKLCMMWCGKESKPTIQSSFHMLLLPRSAACPQLMLELLCCVFREDVMLCGSRGG